jgi:O-glycosyl hydrolase
LSVRHLVVLLAVVALSLAVAEAHAATDLRSEGTSVVVDVNSALQPIHGFGSSVRVWGDPHVSNAPRTVIPSGAQNRILTDLYRRLQLRRVRSLLDQGVQKTRGDRFDFNGKLADDHVKFVKQARRFGVSTFFPAPVYVEPWMGADDVRAYVDWAMAMLTRWRTLGLEPPFYAPLNEPEINNDFPAQWMRDVVRELGSRLKSGGFRTKLVIPDDENPRAAFERAEAVLSDPRARPFVGAIAYHIYRWDPRSRDELARIASLARRHRLPVWMTEYSNREYQDWASAFEWAEKLHLLLTDGRASAVDYMWGFFGNWVRSDTLVAIDFADGVYRGHAPTPLFWVTGHYSRHLVAGSTRVQARASGGGALLVSAYRRPGRIIVIATNPSGRSERLRVALPAVAVRGRVRATRSSATERWRAVPALSLRRGTFETTLPAKSIVTFELERSRSRSD